MNSLYDDKLNSIKAHDSSTILTLGETLITQPQWRALALSDSFRRIINDRDDYMDKVQVASIAIVLSLIAVAFIVVPMVTQTTRWTSLENYMKENYDDPVDLGEGGYTLPESDLARLYPTIGAVMVFEELELLDDRPPVTDLAKIATFTQKLQWSSGGEDFERWGGFSLYIAGPVSIENSYWAVQLWQYMQEQSDIPAMNDVEQLNATAGLVYVNKTQTESGGFGSYDGAPPDIISTYYALYVMNAMLEMAEDEVIGDWLLNSTKTLEWILSCREGDVFKLTPSSHIQSLSATAAALLALRELDQLSILNTTELQVIIDWVVDRQVTEATAQEYLGGFSESLLTNDTNLESTYHALEIVTLLERLDTIDRESAAEFILDCQASDGVWGNYPGVEAGSLFYAGLALRTLNMLDPIDHSYRDLIYGVDPNTPTPPLLDWRIIFIAILIVAAILIGLAALRMD